MPPNQVETLVGSGPVTHRFGHREPADDEQSVTVKDERKEVVEVNTRHSGEGAVKSNGTASNELTPQQHILWSSVAIFTFLHGLTLYLMIKYILQMKILTIVWGVLLGAAALFGVTAGVHRLWSHKTYKAKAPLRLIVSLCYAIAAQYSPWDWVRDHRIHHKFSDTDADPHNATRGVFYSHIGWLMHSKHPETVKREPMIDMSDIVDDKIFMVLTRYYSYFGMIFGFVLPVVIPMVVWDETFECAITAAFAKYIFSLNFTFSINSLAHRFGHKPYKQNIKPTEGLITSIITLGEGWHNYHHAFPWDYRAGELGPYKFNFTTTVLDYFSRIGWAYDLKAATPEMIEKVSKKHGDGSRILNEVPYPED